VFLSFEKKIELMASGEWGAMISSKDYIDIDLMVFIRAEGLLWTGHVVRIVENGIPKRILEGNLGSRRHVGKQRQSWDKRFIKRCCQIAKDE